MLERAILVPGSIAKIAMLWLFSLCPIGPSRCPDSVVIGETKARRILIY